MILIIQIIHYYINKKIDFKQYNILNQIKKERTSLISNIRSHIKYYII